MIDNFINRTISKKRDVDEFWDFLLFHQFKNFKEKHVINDCWTTTTDSVSI